MLALGSPARGQTRWPEERQVGPFLCHADFSLAAHEGLLDEMSRLQEDLVATLGARQTREPIHLFLFRAKTTYRGYLQQYFPRVPYRRALYMKARGPGMVGRVPGNRLVRHDVGVNTWSWCCGQCT